jgi:hypothetical protein
MGGQRPRSAVLLWGHECDNGCCGRGQYYLRGHGVPPEMSLRASLHGGTGVLPVNGEEQSRQTRDCSTETCFPPHPAMTRVEELSLPESPMLAGHGSQEITLGKTSCPHSVQKKFVDERATQGSSNLPVGFARGAAARSGLTERQGIAAQRRVWPSARCCHILERSRRFRLMEVRALSFFRTATSDARTAKITK